MTDRPIIFSSPMVRALLDGRKTQTRRVLTSGCDEAPAFVDDGIVTAFDADDRPYRWPRTHAIGDRLWVREAHTLLPRTAYRGSVGTGTIEQVEHPTDGYTAAVFREGFDRSGRPRWRPSIHMPRWASRLTLTVTDVRVQRLQEISEEDARAEGVELGGQNATSSNNVFAYQCIWDHLNAKRSGCTWSDDPWIVALTFSVERRNLDEVAA